MPTTSFDPLVHGFNFPNRFLNVVAALPSGDRIRTSGRCGGMSAAALDLFHLGRTAPEQNWSSSPRQVPPDGTPIADYLLKRQLESFLDPSALRFFSWTLFPDFGTPFFGGVRSWTKDEVGKVCASIDRGEPCVIGLIGARKLSDVGRRNHQSVAFGYVRRRGGVDLQIYDCNTPRTTTVLEWRNSSSGVAASNRRDPWRGFFVHTYVAKRPPSSIWRRA